MPYKDPDKQREYQREYNRAWYHRNKAKHIARVWCRDDRVLTEIKEKLAAYKLKHGCTDCGYKEHPDALEFDHVRGKKSYNIGNMARQRLSWSAIKKEIKKCEIVCANCHRVRTARRRKSH